MNLDLWYPLADYNHLGPDFARSEGFLSWQICCQSHRVSPYSLCHMVVMWFPPSLQWVLHLYGVCDEQKWSNQKLCPPQPSCWFGKFPRLGEQVRERFVQLFADLACDNAYTVYCIICWYVQYFKVCLFAFVGTIWRRERFMALWFKMKRLRFGRPSQMTKFPILCLSLSLCSKYSVRVVSGRPLPTYHQSK